MTIGIPFVLAFVTESLAIPHNDAWAYSRIAQAFARGEGLHLVGWNRVFLLGQVVLFGQSPSIAGQHATVGVVAVCGLVAVFVLLRDQVGDARALFGTAVMGLVPGFGLLATSFMTDVPAWACGTVCLAISSVAIRRVAPSALAVGLAIGVAGATCRDDAIVAPLAALLAAAIAWRRDRRAMQILFVEALAVLIVFGGLETWRRGMENGDELALALNVSSTAFTSVRAYFTFALFLTPAVAFAVRPGEWSRRARWCALGVAVVGLPFYVQLRGDMMLGNYVGRYGAYEAAAVGTRERDTKARVVDGRRCELRRRHRPGGSSGHALASAESAAVDLRRSDGDRTGRRITHRTTDLRPLSPAARHAGRRRVVGWRSTAVGAGARSYWRGRRRCLLRSPRTASHSTPPAGLKDFGCNAREFPRPTSTPVSNGSATIRRPRRILLPRVIRPRSVRGCISFRRRASAMW